MTQPFYLPVSKPRQYLLCCTIVVATAGVCYALNGYITYHTAALLLLVVVSIIATLFDILPVLVSAALSALVLNFFFLPPVFTLHIRTAEDFLMFVVFFLVAVVNAVFTFRIKREERKTRERAERRNTIRLYNTLFNSLSHELKTPIASVIGAVDTIKDNPSLSEANKDILLTEIAIAGHRLHYQVENLLSMGRLESGMLTLSKDWCDMAELLHTVVQQVKNKGRRTLIVAENNNLPLFKLDIGLIQQAVYNITKNAVLYTQTDAEITLWAGQQDNNCVITVTDNGPGIPEDSLVCLFDKFYRLPHTKAGGTGLGLSIAKGFTEAHGGTISAENTPKGGARFIISLPAEANYLNKLKNE